MKRTAVTRIAHNLVTFGTDPQSALYPVTGLLMKRIAVSRIADNLVTFGTDPQFPLHLHHAYLNIAQTM